MRAELAGATKDPTGKYLLADGNLIQFEVEVGRDSYVGIWWEDATGAVTQLFPNRLDSSHLIAAGKPARIPRQDDFPIEATMSTGPEQVRILATTQRWEPIEGQLQGPMVVFDSPEQKARFQAQLRALRVGDRQGGPNLVSELVIPFEVRGKQ